MSINNILLVWDALVSSGLYEDYLFTKFEEATLIHLSELNTE